MRRLLTTSLIAMIGLLTSGYALSRFITTSPEQIVRQNSSCPSSGKSVAADFKVLGTVKWSEGEVVLYKSLCSSKEGESAVKRVFGYQLAKRNGMSWQLSGMGSYGSISPPPEPTKLIEYGIGQSKSNGSDRYMIVYGQALTPKVASVEATFDNGKVVHVKAKDGVFALVAPEADRICELRVIGNFNQILRRDNLTTTPQPEPEQPKWSNRCWRSTIQA